MHQANYPLHIRAAAELRLRELEARETEAYKYDWLHYAREKQKMPEGEWHLWMVLAGRGFGKTRTATETARLLIDSKRARRIAICGRTPADIRDVLVEGNSGFLNIYPPWERPFYEPSKSKLTFHNGAIAHFYSSESPDKARGPEHDLIIADELAAWRTRELWDNLIFGLRKGEAKAIITTTPRPVSVIRELVGDPGVLKVYGSTYENKENLSEVFLDRIKERYENTRLGKQEIYGQLLTDIEGALWKLDWINRNRVNKAEYDINKIVVAIDPAASSDKSSDETGIIVGGIDSQRHGYVLEDLTLRGTPNEWATVAVNAYKRHKAAYIVAEKNQGGEMIKHVIHSIDSNIKIELVWASVGKRVRAEPISGIYEQNKISHVGFFNKLEDELITWDGSSGSASPNRLDALVWCFTDLLLGGQAAAPNLRVLGG